jgi:thymidylate kinase
MTAVTLPNRNCPQQSARGGGDEEIANWREYFRPSHMTALCPSMELIIDINLEKAERRGKARQRQEREVGRSGEETERGREGEVG